MREHVVVAATRADAPLSTLGVTRHRARSASASRSARRRPCSSCSRSARECAAARTGGLGTQASAFVRGGESRFARVLIDGVPVNEPGGVLRLRRPAAAGAGAGRGGAGRGQQPLRHGRAGRRDPPRHAPRAAPGEAPGLVPRPKAGASTGAGSQGGTSGRRGALRLERGLLRLDTDNEQPNSAFTETAGAAPLGGALGERVDAAARRCAATTSDAGTPGPDRLRPSRPGRLHRARPVVVGGARCATRRGRAAHELRGGLAPAPTQLSMNPADSGSFVPTLRRPGRRRSPALDFPDPAGFQNDTRRVSLGYQAEVQAGARHLLTAGADVERETGELGSRADELLSPDAHERRASTSRTAWCSGDRVFVTARRRAWSTTTASARGPCPAPPWPGARADGADATTLRASARRGHQGAELLRDLRRLVLRPGQPGPEAGAEPHLRRRRRAAPPGRPPARWRRRSSTTSTATRSPSRCWTSRTFRGTLREPGQDARAAGVELALEAAPRPPLSLRAHYTFLDGEILVSTERLRPVYARGPAAAAPAAAPGRALRARAGAGRVGLGATLVAVGERADSDFAGLGLDRERGLHARRRARARAPRRADWRRSWWRENVFDEEYQEALGYPALGRAVRGRAALPRGDRPDR